MVVTMNQGAPEFLRQVTPAEAADILVSMNLETGDLAGEYPMEVVTTGLPYLLIPVRNPEVLSRARISTPDLQRQLQEVGAGFVYLCEPESLECRTWDNLGHVEDVATGSAAGPFGAYLVRYGRISLNETAKIHQGRFVGRPCEIETWVDEDSGDVMIQGAVSVFATGRLEVV